SLRASLRIHVMDHGQERLQRGAKTRDVGRCLDGRENLAALAYEPAGDRRSADVDADRRDLAGDRALSHRGPSVCNSRAMRVFSAKSEQSHPRACKLSLQSHGWPGTVAISLHLEDLDVNFAVLSTSWVELAMCLIFSTSRLLCGCPGARMVYRGRASRARPSGRREGRAGTRRYSD